MHACARRATAAKSTAAPLQPACGRGVPHKAQHTYQMRPPPTSRRCPQESAAPFSLCVLLQAPCVASGRGRSAAGPASRSPPVQVRHASPSHVNAPVAQWIRRLPTEQEIHGSIPCGGMFNFVLSRLLSVAGVRFLESTACPPRLSLPSRFHFTLVQFVPVSWGG